MHMTMLNSPSMEPTTSSTTQQQNLVAHSYTDNVILSSKGSNNFINNPANNTSGGAIHAVINTTMDFIGTSIFSHNSAEFSGGAFVTVHKVVLTFTGTSNFLNNSATTGGAICAVVNASLNFVRNTNFSINLHIHKGRLLSSQYVQQTTKMCTTLSYTAGFSLGLFQRALCFFGAL